MISPRQYRSSTVKSSTGANGPVRNVHSKPIANTNQASATPKPIVNLNSEFVAKFNPSLKGPRGHYPC